jgi:hypothetical protein
MGDSERVDNYHAFSLLITIAPRCTTPGSIKAIPLTKATHNPTPIRINKTTTQIYLDINNGQWPQLLILVKPQQDLLSILNTTTKDFRQPHIA